MKSYCLGFTLLELLLATTLGLVLLGGILNFLLAQQHLYQQQKTFTTLQENARFALHVIHHEIRSAGYIGCPRLQDDLTITNRTTASLTPHNTLIAYTATAPELPANVRKRILPHTEALLIRKLQSDGANLVESNVLNLHISPSLALQAGDIVGISDCTQLDIFTIAHVTNFAQTQLLTPTQALSKAYTRGALVGQFQAILFYVGKTDRHDATGQPIPALYRLDLRNPSLPSELVEFVNDIHFKFGYLNPRTQQIQFVSREQVTDWRQIRAVAIDLFFNDVKLKNSQIWHTTIALRERD